MYLKHKYDRPVKAAIFYLPINFHTNTLTFALQELGFDDFSIKQLTAKCPSPEGPITTVAVPHFLVTLA
jgi:hypothetical protein